VFNGEIYNFIELRRELEVAGHALVGSRLLFASEIKALLQDDACSRKVDLRSLGSLFTLRYVP
jgi:asparagine synthetase B (glutamine-hydrolysing)